MPRALVALHYTRRSDDALGLTDRTAPPDSATCLGLQLAVSAPKTFAHPTVHPPIQQGSFNVPTGGIFVNNTLYAFFWTDHCASAEPLAPNITAPLSLPPATPACQEVPLSNLVGRSVLAAAKPGNPITLPRSAASVSAISAIGHAAVHHAQWVCLCERDAAATAGARLPGWTRLT